MVFHRFVLVAGAIVGFLLGSSMLYTSSSRSSMMDVHETRPNQSNNNYNLHRGSSKSSSSSSTSPEQRRLLEGPQEEDSLFEEPEETNEFDTLHKEERKLAPRGWGSYLGVTSYNQKKANPYNTYKRAQYNPNYNYQRPVYHNRGNNRRRPGYGNGYGNAGGGGGWLGGFGNYITSIYVGWRNRLFVSSNNRAAIVVVVDTNTNTNNNAQANFPRAPTTRSPTRPPTPTRAPTRAPTPVPSKQPTKRPSRSPTVRRNSLYHPVCRHLAEDSMGTN